MATIFFTNTNQIGDGSLYQTVLEAQEGDVVAPDPTVFGVGERVVIDFADILKIERPITLDAGKTRLILRRTTASAVPKDVLIDCVYSTIVSFNARGIAFNGRVLVGGSGQKHRFDKCIFGGFSTVRNSFHTTGNCDVEFNDCAFICGAGSPFFGTSTKSSYKFTRCTIAANKANESSSGRLAATYIDCIDEPDLSTAGFANVPASLDAVDVTKWEEYDFAPLPSSPFATGGATGADETDLLGNKRGWTDESDSTQYAVGAYEVVKADYFLSQDTPPSARFTEPSTWKTTRGGNAPPEVVGTGVFYIDEAKTFVDAPPAGASIVVAGPSRVEIGDACVLDEIRAGARSTIAFKNAVVASSFDLRDESTVEIIPGDVIALDSLTYGAGASAKSTGRAYLSAPEVDASQLTTENVVVGQRSAGLTGFYAVVKRAGEIALSWTCKDSSVPIVVERRVDGEWTTALESALGLTATVPFGSEPVELVFEDWRAWDGDAFLTSTPFYAKVDFFRYWSDVDAAVSVSEWIVEPLVVNEWITNTLTIKAGEMGYRNENALFLALIKNPLTGKLLSPDEVSSITATLYKVGGWGAPNEWAAVDAWTSVPVPVDSVLYTPIDPATLTGAGLSWTKEEGPNFSWAPTTTENVLFSESGSYIMQVKFVLKDGKNPITATFSAKVS